MNEKNLVICDREFCENISRRDELSVKVYICSNMEHVLQLSREKPVHIFVVDETYSYEERCQVKAGQVFVLGRENVSDLGQEERAIKKYQCADGIIREIFEAYTEITKENLLRHVRKGCVKLIAVYSPIHRVGKTKFAMAFGQECAKKKKTLYLNLEEYAGFEETFEEGLNLGDLLYYIKQGEVNLGVRLNLAVRKVGELDYIPPIPVALDLKEVTRKEWETLLNQIMENSRYEMIVLDMGESVQGVHHLLEMCDRVYMPILKDEISERKLLRYEKNLERLKLEKLPRITYKFVMPENMEEYAKIRVKEECK